MRVAPFRILSDTELASGLGRIEPSSEERHHLRVRRAEAGQPIEVLDGRGQVAIGTLGKDGTVLVDRVDSVPRPATLTLLVGAGDRDRFLWLVEKCVEVGVSRLIPIETERSRQVATRVRGEHHDRLVRRGHEALKQSGGAWGMEIGPLVALDRALAAVDAERRWLADPRGAPPELSGPDTTVAAAIGPEGGFTDAEVDQLLAAGFGLTRLGLRTLRFETAALAAAIMARLEGRERHG